MSYTIKQTIYILIKVQKVQADESEQRFCSNAIRPAYSVAKISWYRKKIKTLEKFQNVIALLFD